MEQRVAVITGGLSGMGLATARRLTIEGWMVIQADLKVPAGTESHSSEFWTVITDVTDSNAIKDLFKFVRTRGRLDFLMTCAGIHSGKSIVETNDDDYRNMADVNMRGTFLCIREAQELLSSTPGSSVLTISSDNGLDGDADAPLYCGSKHFIVGLTKSLALNYKRTGVRVNCLCPGPVDTPFLRNACGNNPAIIEATVQSNPLGRLVRPEEIAEVAVLLAESRALNGCIWNIDGGANFSGGNAEPPKVA